MLKMILDGKEISVESLDLSYGNGDLYISVESNTEGSTGSESLLHLNHSNKELFLVSLLESFHAPANMSGYQYLKRALELGMDDPSVFSSITKKVYPVIAQEFDCASTAKVERSLHSVILSILHGDNQDNLKLFFGHTYDEIKIKQNNAFILAKMSTRIRLLLAKHPLEN